MRPSEDIHELLARQAEKKKAERRRAAKRKRPFAEPIDIGVSIDVGAPLPHLVVTPAAAALVFHRGIVDPDWDGTYTTVIDPHSSVEHSLAMVVFHSAFATLMGPPNDEALAGHQLADAGLEPYKAHVVHNSHWIEEYERRNRVHPLHSAQRFQGLTHYVITFHDETFECIAEGHTTRSIDTDFRAALDQAIAELVRSDGG